MLLQAFSLSGVSLPLLLSVESGISKHDIIYYVCAGILTLLVLVGIAMMSKVRKLSLETVSEPSPCCLPFC